MTTGVDLISRRVMLATAAWVGAVCLPAWIWLSVGPPADSDHGGHAPASGGPIVPLDAGPLSNAGWGAIVWMGMWSGMVVAMMLPVAVPTIAAHRFVVQPWGRTGTVATILFAGGYLAVWIVAGLGPMGLDLIRRSLVSQPHWPSLPAIIGGAALVVAGIFQFSALKARCLVVCRTPLQFVLTYRFDGRLLHALRAGAANGLFCLGCCWALMVTQVLLGIHNVVLMAGLALVMLLERLSGIGPRLTPWLGVALIGAGALALGDGGLHAIHGW